MSQPSMNSALRALLENFPYHSVLWQLYYTCRYFRVLKPKRVCCKSVLLHRISWHDVWISDGETFAQEGFYVDMGNGVCHVVFERVCYQVPKEWIRRLFRKDGAWQLAGEDFCCRLNVMYRGEKKFGCSQDLELDGAVIDRQMFHVGISACDCRFKMTFYECKLMIGFWRVTRFFRAHDFSREEVLLTLHHASESEILMILNCIFCECCTRYFDKLYMQLVLKYADRDDHQRLRRQELFYPCTCIFKHVRNDVCSQVKAVCREK